MIKNIFIVVFIAIFLVPNVFALDTVLLDMRNKLFEESKSIKSLITNSSDSVLLTTMWDTCIITMTRIDAYFSMLGIFNTIKEENLSETTINFLVDWLKSTKNINNLNIKGLDDIVQVTDAKTKPHIQTLKVYFKELNTLLDNELNKFASLKQAIKKKK